MNIIKKLPDAEFEIMKTVWKMSLRSLPTLLWIRLENPFRPQLDAI